MNLRDFDAWSGAVETKERILKENKADDFERLIDELYPDGLTDTQLNDLLWFEEDWIFENLGITDEEEEVDEFMIIETDEEGNEEETASYLTEEEADRLLIELQAATPANTYEKKPQE